MDPGGNRVQGSLEGSTTRVWFSFQAHVPVDVRHMCIACLFIYVVREREEEESVQHTPNPYEKPQNPKPQAPNPLNPDALKSQNP